LKFNCIRICKELINNIIKHSLSTEIIISINFVGGVLTISINYNGKGINDEKAKLIMENNRGLGLKSIYGRIQILDGVLNYYTENEQKASVIFSIPIKSDYAQNEN